ncbi:hypothetical protein RRG08_027513 [Elysia crispata]|uniref:Uncharacterized protein n=1 Tax=Elysia crispata TaxID=231223 RepID=A0AAE1D316_9GAST|nr:hypothetical protein RRG08_027513 [Elysia crispata]
MLFSNRSATSVRTTVKQQRRDVRLAYRSVTEVFCFLFQFDFCNCLVKATQLATNLQLTGIKPTTPWDQTSNFLVSNLNPPGIKRPTPWDKISNSLGSNLQLPKIKSPIPWDQTSNSLGSNLQLPRIKPSTLWDQNSNFLRSNLQLLGIKSPTPWDQISDSLGSPASSILLHKRSNYYKFVLCRFSPGV